MQRSPRGPLNTGKTKHSPADIGLPIGGSHEPKSALVFRCVHRASVVSSAVSTAETRFRDSAAFAAAAGHPLLSPSRRPAPDWCPRTELNRDPSFRKRLLDPFELRGQRRFGVPSQPESIRKLRPHCPAKRNSGATRRSGRVQPPPPARPRFFRPVAERLGRPAPAGIYYGLVRRVGRQIRMSFKTTRWMLAGRRV